MRIEGTAAGQGIQRVGAAGGQDREIMELKEKLHELEVERKKVAKDQKLTKEQRQAKMEMLNTQIETIRQQINQKQNEKIKKRMEDQQKAQSDSRQQDVQQKQGAQQPAAVDENQAHKMIQAGVSLSQAQRVDQVAVSMKGRAKAIEAQMELDGLRGITSGTPSAGATVDSTLKELEHVTAAAVKARMETSSRLRDLNKTEDPQQSNDKEKEGALSRKERDDQEQEEEAHIDAWA